MKNLRTTLGKLRGVRPAFLINDGRLLVAEPARAAEVVAT